MCYYIVVLKLLDLTDLLSRANVVIYVLLSLLFLCAYLYLSTCAVSGRRCP